MKITPTKLFALFAGAFLAFPLANAQTIKTAADYLPQTVDVVYEFNTNKVNPFEDLVLANMDIQTPFSGDMFKDNVLTMAMELSGETNEWGTVEPGIYMSFTATDEQLTALFTSMEQELDQETYSGKTMYVGVDTFAVVMDGRAFISNKKELLTGLIDDSMNTSFNSLAELDSYQDTRSHDVTDSFLSFYMSPAFTQEENVANDPFAISALNKAFGFKPEFMEADLAEGFSLAQIPEGFNFGASYKGDVEKLKSMGLSFDKYRFLPSLYKKISGKNIILYTEQNDLQTHLGDVLNMFTADSELLGQYNDWKTLINEETDIDVDTDVLPFMSGKNAFAVHATNQIVPAFTILFDVSAQQGKAAGFATAVSEKLRKYWEGMEKEEGTEFYTYRIDYINGTAYYTHVLNLAEMSGESDMANLTPEQTTLTLHMAVAHGDLLVLSTHPDLGGILESADDMADNEGFNELFKNRDEEVTDLSYISFEGLHQYLVTVMTAMEADEEALAFEAGLLKPWTDMFTKGYAEGSNVWAYGTVRVDVKGFETYPQLFEDLWGFNEEDYVYPEEMPTLGLTFCDVHASDWFNSYVNDLSERKIIQGYNDGCFRPNNDVTRAEFTTMIMNANRVAMAVDSSEQPFTDVAPGEWYTENIVMAKTAGYIEGYKDAPDGTFSFHPNAPITRAEAVTILWKTKGEEKNPTWTEYFDDVPEGMWFLDAVKWAYSSGTVSGVTSTTFEPNRNITRAEAAKIIDIAYPY